MAFWNMLVLLTLCANLAAAVTASSPSNGGQLQCQLVEETQCTRHFNRPFYGVFPTRKLSMSQAVSEFGNFLPLLELNNYCSHVLHSFLCYHYFSPCLRLGRIDEKEYTAFFPCRELCELAWSECLNTTFQHLSIPPPEHLNCQNFPSKYTNSNIVCPDPGIDCMLVVLRCFHA